MNFSNFETIGIAGFGPMGKLMANKMLPEGSKIIISDPNIGIESNLNVPMVDLSFTDAVVLTTPADQLWGVLNDVIIKPKTKSSWDGIDSRIREEWVDPLLIESCSVKMFPEKLIEKIDPEFPELLHCHPLFGPQSVEKGLEGKKVIVTKKRGQKAEKMLEHWQSLGLNIIEMTAEEHDRIMAKIQAVTFVLGRLANRAGLNEMASHYLATPSIQISAELAKLDEAHSEALFRTVVAFNPFVKSEILKLRQSLWQLDATSMSGRLALHAVGLV